MKKDLRYLVKFILNLVCVCMLVLLVVGMFFMIKGREVRVRICELGGGVTWVEYDYVRIRGEVGECRVERMGSRDYFKARMRRVK